MFHCVPRPSSIPGHSDTSDLHSLTPWPPLSLRLLFSRVIITRLYANALLYGTPAGNIHKLHAVCTELLVSRCSASSPRLSQQQTLTSSLASGTQADSVQNCPPNIQESVNQPATIPQKSSSHVTTIAMSPLSQSKSSVYSFLHYYFSKRSFSFSAPTFWNELPAVIRESNTLDTVKRRQKLISPL